MQPAPRRQGLHSGLDTFRFNTNSSLSTAGSILLRNQCFLWLSASKYGTMQPGHARSRYGARTGAPQELNSGRNALLIEYKPTAVASTRERQPLLPPPGRRRLALVRLH
jgi:hypothetical protein